MTATRLELLTWQGVESYLRRCRVILIPIGSTEQHGPNGLIGTDFICAETIACGVAERTDTLVAPTINVGMALHHMEFPGTISLRPETLMQVIADYVTSLHRHGFRGFVFVNGHGGNISPGRAAISNLHEQCPGADITWINWWMCRPVRAAAQELYGDREGSHATPSEVSVTMAVYPDDARVIGGPLDIESCRARGIAGSKQFRKWYPDGRMGSDPSLARPEHGHRLRQVAIDAISPTVTQLAERLRPGAGRDPTN